jgi:hypothetical protein
VRGGTSPLTTPYGVPRSQGNPGTVGAGGAGAFIVEWTTQVVNKIGV